LTVPWLTTDAEPERDDNCAGDALRGERSLRTPHCQAQSRLDGEMNPKNEAKRFLIFLLLANMSNDIFVFHEQQT
jgi:hypothetical protein